MSSPDRARPSRTVVADHVVATWTRGSDPNRPVTSAHHGASDVVHVGGWTIETTTSGLDPDGREDVVRLDVDASGVLRVRRPLGGIPTVYWHRSPERLVVSTRLDRACEQVGRPLALDPFAAWLWASMIAVFPEGRTPIATIRALRPGEHLELGPTKAVVTGGRPVRPPARTPSDEKREGNAQAFRALVLDHLRTHLPTTGILLTLSGGTDSSTLAYAMKRLLGLDYATLSLVPTNPTDREREMASIRRVGDDVRPTATEFRDLTAENRVAGALAAPPSPLPILHPALHHLPDLVGDHGLSALVGGEWLDQLFGSRMLNLDDWLRSQPAWRRPTGRVRGIRRRGMVRASLSTLRAQRPESLFGRLSPLAPEGCRREWQAFVHDEWSRAQQEGHVNVRTELVRRFQEEWIAMNVEACSRVGVRRVAPFHASSVLALGHGLHPSEWFWNGWDKGVLRRAFVGDVPREVLFRHGKEHWKEPEPSFDLSGLSEHLADAGLLGESEPEIGSVREAIAVAGLGQMWRYAG